MCVLAKNIPLILEEVIVLLQIYIMKRALYQILIRQPFNTITES